MMLERIKELIDESDFWIGFNTGGTLVGVLAVAWLLLNTYF